MKHTQTLGIVHPARAPKKTTRAQSTESPRAACGWLLVLAHGLRDRTNERGRVEQKQVRIDTCSDQPRNPRSPSVKPTGFVSSKDEQPRKEVPAPRLPAPGGECHLRGSSAPPYGPAPSPVDLDHPQHRPDSRGQGHRDPPRHRVLQDSSGNFEDPTDGEIVKAAIMTCISICTGMHMSFEICLDVSMNIGICLWLATLISF